MAAKKKRAGKFNAYRRVETSDGISTSVHHQFDTSVPWTEADKRAFEQYFDIGQPEYRAIQLRRQLDGLGEIPQSDQRPYILTHVARIEQVLARIWRVTQSIDNSEWKATMAAGDLDRATHALIRMRAERDQQTLASDELRELDEAEQAWQKITVIPLADKGRRFNRPGRGPGPIRKAITAALRRDPRIKNEALWAQLKARPPRGWDLQGYGKDRRIDTGALEFTSWRAFCNAAAKERKFLRGRKSSISGGVKNKR